MATTVVERDSGASAVLIFILFALLVVGGIWFAYQHGMLNSASAPVTIENNKTIVVPQPAQNPAPAPAR